MKTIDFAAEKTRKAREWNTRRADTTRDQSNARRTHDIHIVTNEWLHASAKRGYAVDEAHYRLTTTQHNTPTAIKRRSTCHNTTSNEHLGADRKASS